MKFFWEVFVTLFVIIDPVGTVPVFLGLTRDRSDRDRNRLAWQATIVAFGVIVVFALFGRTILDYLGVSLPALEGAGGLLLLLVALELLTGRAAEPTAAEMERANVAFVPLGTPLLAGPGAIVATMLFVPRIRGVADAFALAAAMIAVALTVWLATRFAVVLQRVLTDNGVELLTRIAGLLLAAIAVQLVANSIIAFVHSALFGGSVLWRPHVIVDEASVDPLPTLDPCRICRAHPGVASNPCGNGSGPRSDWPRARRPWRSAAAVAAVPVVGRAAGPRERKRSDGRTDRTGVVADRRDQRLDRRRRRRGHRHRCGS